MIGSMEALQKAHAPLLCYLGVERTTPQKKDRLAALATVRISEYLMRMPVHKANAGKPRLDHHGPAVDGKQHSPVTPHGVELPKLPPQPFFDCFCADMPQYGRTALSSCRAL